MNGDGSRAPRPPTRHVAKLAQLRWAAEAGIERVITNNDETNAPMLAINHQLGYRPFTSGAAWIREGTAGGRARAAPGR